MMWIATILCAMLLLWAVYKEWKRPNEMWQLARIVATVFAIASLLLLIIPLRYQTSQKVNEQAVALLTEGWDRDSVLSFIDHHKGASLYTTVPGKPVLNEHYLPDVSLMANNSANLHVFGYGLKDHELETLKKTTYTFHPAALKNTIQNIHWNSSIALGQPLQVTGSYINSNTHPVSLVLSGFATTLDSVSLPAGQVSSLTLNAVPRQVGKAVYSIIVLNGKDTIVQEPVPIDVQATQSLRLLLLASSPDFEQNFLKNWLAAQGFSLAVRTGITTGKWNQEFINRPSTGLGTLSSSLLKQVDLIIADQPSLAHLTPAEKGAIESTIALGNLGLLVRADSTQNSGAFYNRAFSLTGVHDSLTHTMQVRLPGQASAILLATDSPLFISENDQLQPLIKDQQQHLLAAIALIGKGKVITTTINNSFSWQLAGHNDWYHQYWSALLNAATPKAQTWNTWTITPLLPQIDEAVKIRFRNENIPTSLQVGQTLLYPEQDYLQDDQWHTTYWSREGGWQTILQDNQPSGWFYVFDRDNWKGVKRNERLRATKAQAASFRVETRDSIQTVTGEKELHPVYFFLLFLLSAGFLWFEKKRHFG